MVITGLSSVWNKITAVHPSITDIEMRRQSRLLASFIIAMMVPFCLMAIHGLVAAEDVKDYASSFILLSNVGILAVEFYLNRTGRYRASAYLFVLLAFVFIHILSLTGSVGSPSRMFYLGVALLVSSIFLSLRTTLILFLVSVVLQLFFAFTAPQTAVIDNAVPLFFTLVIGPLVMVFWQHRTGIERERQAELQAANIALRESEISLEHRVAARTRDLEVAADVSKQVATVLELDTLLPQLVERTRTGFDLYHVSVFLLEHQTLKYAAGTGEVSQQMKQEAKQFRIDAKGLVPQAGRTQQPVLVNDVSEDKDHVVNPHLPDTRSELALPLVVGIELLGVLDLQSQQTGRFGADELKVLTLLAEQLAVAIQNARLYVEQVTAAEQLRAVDQMKSQFLASMSHELRTPLNAILNFTEFVALGMMGPVNDKQKDALNKALDSGKHLLALINDVLDMTKIESGMLKLFVENNINLREELSAVIATAQTLLQDKPVTFVQDIDLDLCPIVGDKRRIRQILLNLISNASKFTDEGSVTLSVKNRDTEVLFAVIDTGPGIAMEDQEMIFEPFKQTETGLRHAGGTGLGLPISRKLAEAHGGRLWVESQPGEGASFYLALPVESAQLIATLNEVVEENHA